MKLPKGYGFGNAGGGMGGMMQQAMQRAQNMEEELANERVELEQNGCQATFDGRGMILSLSIDQALIDPDDKESLEDVIVGVIRAGFEKSTNLREERVREIMPNIPGMGM
ncbi:MAG: YbaB/EbfC family nucleoid-associated protein [Chthonomonas sp.]|nr:YbaB/EbfC family nucleoid-associated protein [Chthonomonas sp.]